MPFEPGRWESDGGKYWVELHSDGTGSLRLPREDGLGGDCRPEVVEGGVAYTFEPAGTGPYGALTVTVDRPDTPGCEGWSPFLTGAGYWGGGYDWRRLAYSKGDPDTVDLVLFRVG